MSKLKYYQLAAKNGAFKKLVSPGSSTISEMILDGWNFYGYDDETDIPENPILDNDEVREMTAAEIEAAVQAKKLARTTFTKLEIREAFKSLDKEADLDTLLESNSEFKTYWLDATLVDLEHPVSIQALTSFTSSETETLKLQIP